MTRVSGIIQPKLKNTALDRPSPTAISDKITCWEGEQFKRKAIKYVPPEG